MEPEKTAVETTNQAAAPIQELQIDYKAELEKEKSKREKAEKNEENYRLAALKAKGKLPEGTMVFDEETKNEIAKQVAAELLPSLQSSLISTAAKNDVDAKLNELTQNPEEKEAIRYFFEFETNPSSSVDSRLENAKALANKQLISRKAEEIQLVKAKQTNSNSMGSSTESGLPKPGDETFTPEQIKWLQERSRQTGIKIDLEALKKNLRLTNGMPGMFMTGAHTIHEGKNYK